MLSTNQCQALALSLYETKFSSFLFLFHYNNNTKYDLSWNFLSNITAENIIQDDKEISLLHHTVSYHIIIIQGSH